MSTYEAGQEFEPRTYPVTRAALVRYAGASGDFNPIHYSDRIATAVGLPGVIAHGMFTQALAARAVSEWTGGAEIVELSGKFTNSVLVPDDETGAEVQVSAKVRGVETDDAGTRVALALEVTCDGVKVLGMARAVVRVG